MSLIVDGTTGVTFNDSSLQGAAASPYVLKNRIINGDMRIDQRNAGASVTPSSGNTYTLDRWFLAASQASKVSIQQSSTAPTGFNNSLKVTSLSAYTVGASDYFDIVQKIEGYNIADLGFGTASAKTFTFSFWVQSSLTGTFGGVLLNGSENYSYPFTYTISAANTWEQKTITVTAPTGGTWFSNNNSGLEILFGLGVGSTYSGTANSWTSATYLGATGSTSVVGTNAATWYITGVQIEIGTSATPFERRLYGQELINCQRYFQIIVSGSGYFSNAAAQTTTNAYGMYTLPVTMRTAPTGYVVTGTNYYRFLANDADDYVDSVYVNGQSSNNVIIGNSTQISNTQGRPGVYTATNAASFVAAQAEL